jgi:hypothetical protein
LCAAWARTILLTCAPWLKDLAWPTAPGAILAIEHGHKAKTAHPEAVDTVRAVARRWGDAAWRLVS